MNSSIIEDLKRHWLTIEAGWEVLGRSRSYPYADFIAKNSDKETYLFCVAESSCPDDSVANAVGRLAMMMNRDVQTNILGVPERDLSFDPVLIRFVLAIRATSESLKVLRQIPLRVRRLLNLVIVVVDDNSATKYLETIPI